MSETNERYLAKHGHGYGSVLSGEKSAPLKTLNVAQLDALVNVILWGDIHEIGLDEDTLGRIGASLPTSFPGDSEADTRLQIVAALVYLSGRLAEDIPSLQEKEKPNG
jgi:hypothetical protein